MQSVTQALVGVAQCADLLLVLLSFIELQAEVRDNHPKVMQLLQDYAAAKAAAQQQQEQQPVPQLKGIDRQNVALTPLGTCSACPSNHRNVSSYYLDLFDKGGLLMDCGEC
jgi:ribonuclease Z